MLDPRLFDSISQYITSKIGVKYHEQKLPILEGRLLKRMNQIGIQDFVEYFDLVQSDKEEHDRFIDLVTTHETSFYRTPRIWKFYESWMNQKSQERDQVYIWSAACSTGEELYTSALMGEHVGVALSRLNLFGTDVSAGSVEKAKQALFKQRAVEPFTTMFPWCDSFFLKDETNSTYSISDRIRNKAKFSIHNLLNPSPFNMKFDLVFLRNVLIYFKPAEQNRVLTHIASSLKEGGILIIGESESIDSKSFGLELVEPLIYKRI